MATESDEGEPEVQLLKLDGTPMFIKAECKHDEVHEDIRLEFYNQYKQFVRFLSSFED